MSPSDITNKLWNYCHVLRDDGMSYGDYVEQLTYLLFLKMANERAFLENKAPNGADLIRAITGAHPPGTLRASKPAPGGFVRLRCPVSVDFFTIAGILDSRI